MCFLLVPVALQENSHCFSVRIPIVSHVIITLSTVAKISCIMQTKEEGTIIYNLQL